MLVKNLKKVGVDDDMNFISEYYNMYHNSIELLLLMATYYGLTVTKQKKA